jgi:UrcA family protein
MNYSKLMSISAAVVLTSGVFVLVAPPAFGKAGPVVVVANPNVVIRHISFADLNLASAAGERTLNRRVGGAVSSLCQEATGGIDGNYMTTISAGKCRQAAWNQALPQITQVTQRARDIASTGVSPIAAAAITIALPQ